MVENSHFALTQTNSAEIQYPIHLLHNGHLKKKNRGINQLGRISELFNSNIMQKNIRGGLVAQPGIKLDFT